VICCLSALFVQGTRQVGSVGVPLWLIGTPLQKLTSISLVRSMTQLPFLGPLLAPLFTPPVSVHAVAKAAVDAALAKGEPPKTVIEVDDLLAMEP
jgi:multisubunit Na+/H+ antiporter MnhG subunit